MNHTTVPADAPEPAWKRLLTPWRIAAALLAGFLLSQAYFSWQDRSLIAALNSHPPFAMPAFELRFSRRIPYDPLTFVGRGARAGLWKWTPEGLELTPEGGAYFRMEGEWIVSHAVAGRRRYARLRERTREGEHERIAFFYQWEEISIPAVALLFPPPELGKEYLATAVMSRTAEGWTVRSLQTRDYDEPLAHLQSIASGVRR